jgi:hypothetical protein
MGARAEYGLDGEDNRSHNCWVAGGSPYVQTVLRFLKLFWAGDFGRKLLRAGAMGFPSGRLAARLGGGCRRRLTTETAA